MRITQFLSAFVLLLLIAPNSIAAEAKDASKETAADTDKVPRLAVITTEYRRNSHAEIIAGRVFNSYTLDGKGTYPKLKIVSMYTDQVPENDVSREQAQEFGFKIADSVEEALTLGTGELAVDGVLLIAEHGKYEKNEVGQTIYPKRRLFGEVAKVFEKAGKSVPVFSDKHLADNWNDAKWLYDTAEKLEIPLMAGSSLPGSWRIPETGVKPGSKVKELVMISYGSLDAYGFHALEAAQALVETRAGGETGVKSVQAYEGEAVWEAGKAGVYDEELLKNAIAAQRSHLAKKDRPLVDLVRHPVLFHIEYTDGLVVNMLSLQGAVADWCASWRYEDGQTDTVLFWLQEERPYFHFALLLQGVEKMMHSGKPTWNPQRTLMTSGLLYTGHRSLHEGGKKIETPYLQFAYEMPWVWKNPPPAPPDQPRPPRVPKPKPAGKK